MSAFEIAVIITLNVATVLLTGAWLRVSHRLTRIEQAQYGLTSTTAQHLGEATPEVGSDHDHAVHPSISSGQRLPVDVKQMSTDESWLLIVGVTKDCRACERVLEGLPQALLLLSSYDVVVFTAAADLGVPGPPLTLMQVSEELLEGAPYALLVSSDKTIQGHALVHSASDILEFVADGQARGFGPGLLPAIDSRAQ